jgi:uncharacterized repeat protein (TIGR03803 family)
VDGSYPNSLVVNGSTIYGTTYQGGGDGVGNVFSLNTNGTGFSTLHAFTDGTGDGGEPAAPVLIGSTLYGALETGAIYQIGVNGNGFAILHSFQGNDGQWPYDEMTVNGATMYGMTLQGGAGNDGTLYAFTVPEPSTLILLGIGAIGLLGWRWKRMAATRKIATG